METGMFEKVLVSPMSRSAVFLGKALSEMARIVVQISRILVLGYVLFWLSSSDSSAPYIATGLLGALGIIVIGVVILDLVYRLLKYRCCPHTRRRIS